MKTEKERRKITDDELNLFYRLLIEDEKSLITIEKYIHDVEDFARFADEKEINKLIVIQYKEKLVGAGCFTPRTINTKLAAVNSFLKHMGWHECIVKTLKIQHDAFRDEEKELTRSEYERLLRTAKEKGKERICLVMQTICATGIRVSELRFITVEAVKAGHVEINMKGKTRKILIPADLKKLLIKYIGKTGRQTGSIFVTRNGKPLDRSNICREMKALCEEAGIEKSKVFPHNLRHLFACVYCEQDKNINNLADLLGHANINTTRIYTQISMNKLLKTVNKMGLAAVSPWETGQEKKRKASKKAA